MRAILKNLWAHRKQNGWIFAEIIIITALSWFIVDYVVVHELAHIKQHNHSPAFYKEIEKILPDYRDRIKELKAT